MSPMICLDNIVYDRSWKIYSVSVFFVQHAQVNKVSLCPACKGNPFHLDMFKCFYVILLSLFGRVYYSSIKRDILNVSQNNTNLRDRPRLSPIWIQVTATCTWVWQQRRHEVGTPRVSPRSPLRTPDLLAISFWIINFIKNCNTSASHLEFVPSVLHGRMLWSDRGTRIKSKLF